MWIADLKEKYESNIIIETPLSQRFTKISVHEFDKCFLIIIISSRGSSLLSKKKNTKASSKKRIIEPVLHVLCVYSTVSNKSTKSPDHIYFLQTRYRWKRITPLFLFIFLSFLRTRCPSVQWFLIMEIKAHELALFESAFTRRAKLKRRAFQKNPRTAFRPFALLFSHSRVVGDHLTLPARKWMLHEHCSPDGQTRFLYLDAFAGMYIQKQRRNCSTTSIRWDRRTRGRKK